ncbi:retrotransposon protein, putative, ty1-copia subclass [Tanacetum coccineum]
MTGSKFHIDWVSLAKNGPGSRRITFDYLYKPCPGQPADTATEAEKAAFKAEYKKNSDVACIMLGKMSPALQRQFENYPPQNMLVKLQKMFEKPPAVEIYDLVDALHSCRQAPGKPVSEHVLEMKGIMDQLHTLGKPYDNDMAVNLINRLAPYWQYSHAKASSDGRNGKVQILTSPILQNRDEPCVYRKASGSDVVFLILYVDDILIMGNNIPKLKEVKDYLGKCFSVKDLGEAAYILGIKIYRDRSLRLIGLNQSAYIDKILKKFSMQNSKKGFIPMEVKHDLSNEMCASSDEEKAYMKKVPYASAVGSIMYAVRCTRPDVAFAQNLVSRYQQNPGKLHWVAVKHILKYLRNTKDMFLVYGGNPDTELEVTGFCDASWQCDKDDTKSQTGYVFVVNGGAVDWKSKKQTTIAMHATQSEYMAASEAAMEAVWIRKFVGDLGVMPSINKPINMYCDNSAAITFANEPGVMKGARHFLRRYHYVREQVESGEIKLIKVHTDKNLADAFTKALPRGKVNEHANGIGLRLASSFMHICD